LINNLLEISRLQTGRLFYSIEVFDLYEVVRGAVESMQETAVTHHLLLERSAHAQVSGDKDRLGQVFTNLLSNAIKYSPHGSQIIISVVVDNERVIVSVQDAGTGIAEAHHEKIFERFYQVSNPQEKPFSGLGIGLYLSSEIVKRHGGRIWVESQKGEGATFYVALPLVSN
jgi:two-component system CheB/CheR fusion protein